jgi:hypothetical protein
MCLQYQDRCLQARSGSKWTDKGIEQGLQDKDLLPSLIRDFGAWMCMQPNMFEVFFIIFTIYYILNDYYRWPTPSSISITKFKGFDHALPQRPFLRFYHLKFFLRFWQIVRCLLLSTSHPHVILAAISSWPLKS